MRIRSPILVIFFILVTVWNIHLFAAASADAQCECQPCCPRCCIDLHTNRDVYRSGEEVFFVFSNPRNYKLAIERIYVLKRPFPLKLDDILYIHDFVQPAIPGDYWIWTWSQKDDRGCQAPPGRYLVVVETRCCGNYMAKFGIVPTKERVPVPQPEIPKLESKEEVKKKEKPEPAKAVDEAVEKKAEEKMETKEPPGDFSLCVIAGLVAVAAALLI